MPQGLKRTWAGTLNQADGRSASRPNREAGRLEAPAPLGAEASRLVRLANAPVAAGGDIRR